MRIIQIRDGKLELRWTWLPYWLAVNPALKTDIERRLKDTVLINGMTSSDADLDALHDWVVAAVAKRFSEFAELGALLDALRLVREPS